MEDHSLSGPGGHIYKEDAELLKSYLAALLEEMKKEKED
jgi:hypothetical protein